jgi:hypothetical protein
MTYWHREPICWIPAGGGGSSGTKQKIEIDPLLISFCAGMGE